MIVYSEFDDGAALLLYIISLLTASNVSCQMSSPLPPRPPEFGPPEFDATTFAIAFPLAHIPLFAGIAVAVVVGIYCCYRKRKKNKADLTAIAEKGGLVILDEKLIKAKEEGRLTVNVSVIEVHILI